MADINRETRKQELRRRVVDADALRRNESGADSTADGTGGRTKPVRRMPRALLIVLIILLLLAAGGGIFLLLRRQFRGFSVNWKVDFTQAEGAVESDYEDYEIYSDGFVKVTRDGASYINSSGKTVWNQSYEMNKPYVAVNGDFCAIADQGKTGIYIMGANGTTGQAETSLPITKITVSRTGVVYALLEDSDASYITVFTKEGKALDISIKSILNGDGYPVDLSVSPDGTELITSFAYIKSGTLQNKVIFYNLDEVGKNAGTNRVVGGFDEDFKGVLAGRVHFSDDTHAQAFYNGGIAFFSTKVLTSPELTANVAVQDTIRSIAYSGDYVGIVTDNTGGDSGQPYKLMVFRLNGQKVFEKPFQFNYSGFDIDRQKIILYNDTSMQVYDGSGNLKYSGKIDTSITRARVSGTFSSVFGLNMLVGSSGAVESIKLK